MQESCLKCALTSAKTVCYYKYGCYDQKWPFNRPLEKLPESPQKIGTHFRLFTRASSSSQELDDTDVRKLRDSRFDGKKRTVLIAHGFLGKLLNCWYSLEERSHKKLVNRSEDWSSS